MLRRTSSRVRVAFSLGDGGWGMLVESRPNGRLFAFLSRTRQASVLSGGERSDTTPANL